MKTEAVFHFGQFRVDTLSRTLRREEEIVTLSRRAFDVLLYLVQNPGKVVSRDELLKNVWPDAFVDENSLAQSISVLRRALEEKPGDHSYIVTLPGRGYQFVKPVETVAPENPVILPDGATANHRPGRVIVHQQTTRTSVVTEENPGSGTAALPRAPAARFLKLGKIAVPVLLAGLLLAGALYQHYRSQPGKHLTEKDTVVLADFANSTGDAIFDDTLKTALNISLRQSPFLNVLPDGEVTRTLRLMTRPAGTKLTPGVASEVCLRAGGKAYVAGAVGSLGSEYVLGLKAVNCQSGDTLAEEQVTAPRKEKVLEALGEAASKLRGELGESLATVQKFDVPLHEATTSSLEALKAFSLGNKVLDEKGAAASLPYYQHAIELDPNFAMGYWSLGLVYARLGEAERTSEYVTKAFELREHASEGEKLAITANYYQTVTRELDKAALVNEEWIDTYPRQGARAYGNLGLVYAEQGDYAEAAEMMRRGKRLIPGTSNWNENLVNHMLALQRFDEARQISNDALARNGDDIILRTADYALAFIASDSATMAEQEKWFAGKPHYETYGLALASDTEAYSGHVKKARELTGRAVDLALRADDKEGGAVDLAIAAQREAAYGNATDARKDATEALQLAPTSQGAEAEAALAFAMAGDTARAESLAQDLGKRFPLGTQMQSLWLPPVKALLALDRKNPSSALNALQAPSAIELGNIPFAMNLSCLYPTYVRGEAYLAAGQGNAAAAEFQKILDHNGIVWNCWTGAMARLGLARADALRSRTLQGSDVGVARARALAAYTDFFTLWKDADRNIPILNEAKAEYAKLQ
jgi:DNA-binding winged helix-turn-helix (wHTH) protein/tetratricopeptide (TPR) repeat protein